MSSYKDYKKRALQNPKVKAEYDALQPEYDIIQAMIDARVQQNMTQKDLSAKTGITQADISRIENGTRNPSLSMVKKLAQGTVYDYPVMDYDTDDQQTDRSAFPDSCSCPWRYTNLYCEKGTSAFHQGL